MKNIIIFIFLTSVNFWGYNQTRYRSRGIPAANLSETWEIVEISSGRILSFKVANDTVFKLPKAAIGYPIKYYSIDEIEYWDDNKNRYLFKYDRQYCVADSNLNIIVDLADSIITDILSDPLGAMKIDYLDNATFSCLYQVIRNNKTQLFDNDGIVITDVPFEGMVIFSDWKLENALNQKVYWTSSIDETKRRKFGVIDVNGKMLIPNEYDYISPPEYWSDKQYFFLINYSEDGHSDTYSVFSIPKKSIVFEGVNMYLGFPEQDVYIFEKEGLFGLYHPTLGVLEKPKYLKIYRKRTGQYYRAETLTLITKKGKETTWDLPEKVWDLYPTLKRD